MLRMERLQCLPVIESRTQLYLTNRLNLNNDTLLAFPLASPEIFPIHGSLSQALTRVMLAIANCEEGRK